MTQPDPAALKARNNLFAMFVVLCILDIILVAIARDMWAIGRILLTIVVMYSSRHLSLNTKMSEGPRA